jgi:cytochrome c2
MKPFKIFLFSMSLGLFVSAQASGAAKGKAGDAGKGKAVFEQCAVCHSPDPAEKKSESKLGPGLKGLFQRAKLETNGKKPTEQNVRERVDTGGNGMPSYKEMLTDQEKDDLIAYLKTL